MHFRFLSGKSSQKLIHIKKKTACDYQSLPKTNAKPILIERKQERLNPIFA